MMFPSSDILFKAGFYSQTTESCPKLGDDVIYEKFLQSQG